MRTLAGYVLGATALVACPCHLPITLPLLLVALAGTPLAMLLGARPELVLLGAAVYFVVALFGAIRLLSRRSAADRRQARPSAGLRRSDSACSQSARMPGMTRAAKWVEMLGRDSSPGAGS